MEHASTSRPTVMTVIAGLDIGNADGGAERAGAQMALSTDQAAFRPVLCVFWRSGSPVEREWEARMTLAGIPVVFATREGLRRNSADALAGIRGVIAHARAQHADVIHAHHEGGALAAAIARLRGRTRVALRSMHVPRDLEWGRGVAAALLRAVVSGVLLPLLLDEEVAIAHWYADGYDRRIMARLLRRRAQVIVNSRTLPAEAPRSRDANSPVTIGTVGRLVAQKDQRTLIEALPAVLARCAQRPFVCQVIGDGEMRAELESRVRQLGLQPYVIFLGQRADAIDLMRQFDVFVFPSAWEGVPTVLLEAIALGVPAVATDAPGTRDVIGAEHALLTPPGDAAALADAIAAALNNPERSRQRAVAAQSLLPRYTIEAAAAACAERYRAMLRR